MGIYIKGMGNISPQNTWGAPGVEETVEYKGNRLQCIDPDYEQWIDVRAIRRMSRILKLGTASAFMALKDAGVDKPDGIITGTGFGCLEDTGIFLSGMIEKNEQNLNPTPFIQSTHNTIGSQIALMLNCYGYNQTYTHDAFSFESALLDTLLTLKENPDQRLLVGGVDEITEFSHSIHSRFNIFSRNMENNIEVFKSAHKGMLHGEGAAWFVVSGEGGDVDRACIESVATFYKPSEAQLRKGIDDFLMAAGMRKEDVGMVLLGTSGDNRFDRLASEIAEEKFIPGRIGVFKHLCGEYPVASAFALWLASRILHTGKVPKSVAVSEGHRSPGNVLIFNQYFGTHYSLILASSCRDTP
jgi:3-oxoacyl-[acyl-carrier-protein] synthase II